MDWNESLTEFMKELETLSRKYKIRLVPVVNNGGALSEVLIIEGRRITATFFPEPLNIPDNPENPPDDSAQPPMKIVGKGRRVRS